MDLFRPLAAVLAGSFLICGLVGCRVGAGRPVIWLRDQPVKGQIREVDTPPPAQETAEYKPVGEYSVPAEQLDGARQASANASSQDLQTSESHRTKARRLFGNGKAQSEEYAAGDQSPGNVVSEPVETQQKLVPQPERIPGFWERVGNGFRYMSDLARGQRPVNALVVLPFKPDAEKKSEQVAEDSETPRYRIPAFSLQSREPIAQAAALNDLPAPAASDLVSHWSEFPAAADGTKADGPQASTAAARMNSQAASMP